VLYKYCFWANDRQPQYQHK